MTDPYDAMTIEAQKARIEEVKAALREIAEECLASKSVVAAVYAIASKALGEDANNA